MKYESKLFDALSLRKALNNPSVDFLELTVRNLLCLEECGIVLFCPKILTKAGKNCDLMPVLGISTLFETLCKEY